MCDIYNVIFYINIIINNILLSYVPKFNIRIFLFAVADEEPEKKELLGVNTGIITKPAKPNPFVKIFSFFHKELHIKLSQPLQHGFCMHFSNSTLLQIYMYTVADIHTHYLIHFYTFTLKEDGVKLNRFFFKAFCSTICTKFINNRIS